MSWRQAQMLAKVAEPRWVAWIMRDDLGAWGFLPYGPRGEMDKCVGPFDTVRAAMDAAEKWRRADPRVDRPWER